MLLRTGRGCGLFYHDHHAKRRTPSATGEWESLGYLPNANACPSRSSGHELSADGSVAVGLSWDGCSGRAFRWTQAGGMVDLLPPFDGNESFAVAVNAAGSVVGQSSRNNFQDTHAVLWRVRR